LGAIIDLGVQLFQNGGDLSQVNWTSVGVSGLAGMASAGWGGFVSSAVKSVLNRLLLNAVGSAVIGGIAEYGKMYWMGEWGGCDLIDDWTDVIRSSLLSGGAGL